MLGQPTAENTYANRGMVLRKSNDDLEREESLKQEAEKAQNQPFITSLSGHVTKCWEANKRAKQPIEEILLKCLRARTGKYDPSVRDVIEKQGESDIYMMVTDIKCRAAESWIKDTVTPAGERPFHFDPTPIPDLPQEYYDKAKAEVTNAMAMRFQEQGIDPRHAPPEQVKQIMLEVSEAVKEELSQQADEQAQADADESTREVNDELIEGNWYQALDDMISDIVDYPAAFLHGPIVRKKRKVVWKKQENGTSLPTIETVIVREYESVSPFDMYPCSSAKTTQDGNLIHRLKYSRKDLTDMIGVPGFDEGAIRAVLALHGAGGLRNWLSVDTERATLEDHHDYQSDPEATIECIKFMGSVQGRLLLEWGMTDQEVPDEDMDYPVIVYQIGSFIISARINPHPLGKRKYYSASFDNKANSIWGKGVPQLMFDIQRICNSCARALIKNMGIASGPQVWSIVDRMPDGTVASDMYPWKHWKFTSAQTSGRADLPMGFFQPQIIVEQLLKIYQFFYDQASEITGIPAYIYGSEKTGGAGSTARGLTMLMNAASRGLKMVAKHIDRGIITPSVEEHWFHIIYNEPERCKGDIRVIARASDYLLQQEQLQLVQEQFLGMTNNPVDMEIMGYEGRGEILRELAKSLKIPVDKLVPDRDSLLNVTAEKRVQGMLQNISQALGVDPNVLMQLAQGINPQQIQAGVR